MCSLLVVCRPRTLALPSPTLRFTCGLSGAQALGRALRDTSLAIVLRLTKGDGEVRRPRSTSSLTVAEPITDDHFVWWVSDVTEATYTRHRRLGPKKSTNQPALSSADVTCTPGSRGALWRRHRRRLAILDGPTGAPESTSVRRLAPHRAEAGFDRLLVQVERCQHSRCPSRQG